MTHDEAMQALSAQIDGELTPEQEQALEAWLRDNPDGKIVAEAFRSQDAETRRAFEPRREAAALTAERVIEQLPMPAGPARAPAPHSRWKRLWSVLPPVAAVAVLAIVAIYWLPPHQPDMRISTRQVAKAKPES